MKRINKFIIPVLVVKDCIPDPDNARILFSLEVYVFGLRVFMRVSRNG